MNTAADILLRQGLIQATVQLSHFARQDNWLSHLQIAFGDKFDPQLAANIASQFQAGDFSLLPKIQVLTDGELGSANGAYACELDRILVSLAFLEQMAGDINAVAELLLEEIGHKLDCVLNGNVDSPGDEGAIFLLLATGYPLSEDTLAALRATDDREVVKIDGKLVSIEKQDFRIQNSADTEIRTEFGKFIEWFFV